MKKIRGLFMMLVAVILVIVSVFDLQFSLIIDPLLGDLIWFVLLILVLVSSIVHIYRNKSKEIAYYIALIAASVAFFIACFTDLNVDIRLHYLMNKDAFELIDEEIKVSGIHSISDMLRHQKRLNDKRIEGGLEYRGSQAILANFGHYIEEQGLDIDKIVRIQEKIIALNVISISRNEDLLVLTIDGILDNEYGYLKSSQPIKIGDSILESGVLVSLLSLGDGWYFYSST